jgi:hypothetical protein
MNAESPDLLSQILTASIQLDELGRKARKVADRIARLDDVQRHNMPTFSGPWIKDAIEIHLERLEEAARQPIRGRNRQRLESVGVTSLPMGTELLDDSEVTDIIVEEVRSITGTLPPLAPYIVAQSCLPSWLAKGGGDTRARLAAIKQGLNRIQKIMDSTVPVAFREEALTGVIADPSRLKTIEDDLALVSFALSWELELASQQGLVALHPALLSLHEAVSAVQSEFPEQIDTLRSSLRHAGVDDAGKALRAVLNDCRRQYDVALAEWNRLGTTARLLGLNHDGVAPRSLAGLEQQISEFSQHCAEKLGETGVAILQFLKGEGDFPRQADANSLEKALLAVRPFLTVKNGAGNA